MAVDPRNFLFNSNYQTDKILRVISSSDVGTITTPTNTFGQANVFPTGIAETTLFDASFRLSGGSTRSPMGGYILFDDSNTDLQGLFNSVTMSIMSEPNQITVYTNNNSLTTSSTIEFDIVLIAKSNQGPVEIEPIDSNFTFDTRQNYLKIAEDDIYPFTAPPTPFTAVSVTPLTVVDHNLGYIPMTRTYIEYNNKMFDSRDYYGVGGPQLSPGISISESSLVLTPYSFVNAGSVSADLHYRIYYDS